MPAVFSFLAKPLLITVFTSGFRFLFTLHTRLFIMLTLANLRKNACFCALFFKAPNRTVKRFILTNLYLSQTSFPPLNTNLHRRIAGMQERIIIPEILYRLYPFRNNLSTRLRGQTSCRPEYESAGDVPPVPPLLRSLLPPYSHHSHRFLLPFL